MLRIVTFKIDFNRKYVAESVDQKLTLPGERGYVAERKFWFSRPSPALKADPPASGRVR